MKILTFSATFVNHEMGFSSLRNMKGWVDDSSGIGGGEKRGKGLMCNSVEISVCMDSGSELPD